MGAGTRAAAFVVLAAACFGREESKQPAEPTPPATTPPVVTPPIAPIQRGAWTFYGTGQGLSQDVQDVSADEAGNVYVAGGDAVYVKRPADQRFLRFDPSSAGLTKNCNDYSEFFNETPTKPFTTCRILAVAGASPGKAIIGFDSFPVEQQNGAKWTLSAGGADVLAFDAAKGTLTRTRHAWLASSPHVVCGTGVYGRVPSCPATYDYWWDNGRRLFVQVRRIVVNHDRTSPMYGDVWLGGQHATFAAILNDAAARGLPDRTAGWGPEWADAKDTWEHLHPAIETADGKFVNGLGWALSIDPRDGTVWGSNEYRTTWVVGYGADLSNDYWWDAQPPLDIWPDPPNQYETAAKDNVHSMSHCRDGTLWIGSTTHGLARRDPDGHVSTLDLPDASLQNSVSAVACDADGSLWIGLGTGGIMRMRSGSFERLDTAGLPDFTLLPVQSIQIDRWSTPRVVWFAFAPETTWDGIILRGGGAGAYAGP